MVPSPALLIALAELKDIAGALAKLTGRRPPELLRQCNGGVIAQIGLHRLSGASSGLSAASKIRGHG